MRVSHQQVSKSPGRMVVTSRNSKFEACMVCLCFVGSFEQGLGILIVFAFSMASQ